MVHNWWSRHSHGGVVTVIDSLARSLGPGNEVCLLVDDWDCPTLARERDGDLVIYRLRLAPPHDAKRPVRAALRFVAGLRRTLEAIETIVEREDIDLAHLHYPSSYQYYFRLLRRLPYVVTLHYGDTMQMARFPPWERRLVESILRHAHCTVSVSADQQRQAQSIFPRLTNLAVVYNGVDAGQFSPDPSAEPALATGSYYVCVSNLLAHKGQDTLIRAWAELREPAADLALLLVGDGGERRRFEDLAASLGVGDRVHFAGSLPRPAVAAAMAGARGFLYPTQKESFGLVLAEAGLCGLAAVCSGIAPLTEIAEDETSALFVPAGDAQAFARAVERLEREPELKHRLGENLRRRVDQSFTTSAMARSYLALYREALAARGGAAPTSAED